MNQSLFLYEKIMFYDCKLMDKIQKVSQHLYPLFPVTEEELMLLLYTLSHGFQQGLVFEGEYDEKNLQELHQIKNIKFKIFYDNSNPYVFIYNTKKQYHPFTTFANLRQTLSYKKTPSSKEEKLYQVNFYTVKNSSQTPVVISSFRIDQSHLFEYHHHFEKLTNLLKKINYITYFKFSTI